MLDDDGTSEGFLFLAYHIPQRYASGVEQLKTNPKTRERADMLIE
jgi:hypothetical protein